MGYWIKLPWILAVLLVLSSCAAGESVCELIPEGQVNQFNGTWLFEFVGRPGNITDEDVATLEEILHHNCENAFDNSTYSISNVRVLNVDDYGDETLSDTATRHFAWYVHMMITTNVLDENNDFLEHRRLSEIGDDWYLRRSVEAAACHCALPNRAGFLQNLRTMILMTPGLHSIDNVVDMVKTEEVECSSGNSTFSATYAMEVLGYPEDANNASLAAMATLFQATYNTINLTSCDVLYRTITGVAVTVESVAPGASRLRRELLEATSLLPSDAPSENPTIAPTSSLIPTISVSPTELPTLPPTRRQPDLLTLLYQVDGSCRGCSSETFLFDDVLSGRRLEGNTTNSTQQCFCPVGADIRGPTSQEFLNNFNENAEAIKDDNFPFLTEATSIEHVVEVNCTGEVEAFQRYLSAYFEGDPDKLTEADLRAIEEKVAKTYNDLKQRVCDTFFRVVITVRTVEIIPVVTESPSQMPSNLPSLKPSEVLSDVPSSLPSVSMAPSNSSAPTEPSSVPSLVPTFVETARRGLSHTQARDLEDVGDALPSMPPNSAAPSASMAPSSIPSVSSEPSVSQAPSNSTAPSFQPSTSPTMQGPVHFGLVFLLEGVCNGCSQDIPLFDQLSGRRKLERDSQSKRSLVLIENNASICYCNEDLEERAVTEEEFFEIFEEEVESVEIEAVEEVIESVELVDYVPPTNSPTTSPAPSDTPTLSQMPSNTPPVDPVQPSSQPSAGPSVEPGPGETLGPTTVPTDLPTSLPTDEPTHIPTTGPSAFPSTFPSSYPSSFPSSKPSMDPSTVPSEIPTVDPSTKPSTHPTGGPTSGPTFVISAAPSQSPSNQPSTCPIDRDSYTADTYIECSTGTKDLCVQKTGIDIDSSCFRRRLTGDQVESRNLVVDPEYEWSCMFEVFVFDELGCSDKHEEMYEFTATVMSGSAVPCEIVAVHRDAADGLDVFVKPNCARKTDEPSSAPTNVASSPPTPVPSAGPSTSPPSTEPTTIPSAQPSSAPTTSAPSTNPSSSPTTSEPSALPTTEPSQGPTKVEPSGAPSTIPSSPPTETKPSLSPSQRPTKGQSMEPSSNPTRPSPEPSGLPTEASDSPSVVPSSKPSTSTPSANPTTSEPSANPTTSEPSSQPSSEPTEQPSTNPSNNPTGVPSDTPTTSQPSDSPTDIASNRPSSDPTTVPSDTPTTSQPSDGPTDIDSNPPTGEPSAQPSSDPTGVQSSQPTDNPSGIKSKAPSDEPTIHPSGDPTGIPSPVPSSIPTTSPSSLPTDEPTPQASKDPTGEPSVGPSPGPTSHPSGVPTKGPTDAPSSRPTAASSASPSPGPTNVASSSPTTGCDGLEAWTRAEINCGDTWVEFEVSGGIRRKNQEVGSVELREGHRKLVDTTYSCRFKGELLDENDVHCGTYFSTEAHIVTGSCSPNDNTRGQDYGGGNWFVYVDGDCVEV